ncbi:metallophosphoesterase [Solibacillus silvestris]|uniref:metallophosphoesterase n=1 Tax=Solibacillus silvestris TaxID=76853 RepID=UPI003F7D9C82
MRILLGIVAIAFYSGITFYLGWNLRIWLLSIQQFRWPIFYWILLFFVSYGYFIGKLHPLLTPFSVLGSYWMFFLQYGLILCIAANLIIKFTPLTTKMVGTGVASLLVVLLIAGTYFAYSPVVRNVSIKIDKPGEDMRIVMASDFHFGLLSGKGHLERFVALSNEQNPDLVILPGDIVDDSPQRFINKGMGEVMKNLQATYGVYGVLGNHEYYGNEIPAFKEAMAESDVHLLMDETILVANRFYLTGREDLTNKNRLALGEMQPENKDIPWFVMNHTPNDLDEPAKLGADLHVSGHTHKGQMWPNHFITQRIFELDYGYRQKEGMHALVSSGFGFWGPPTRIGSQSELWVIDVKFSE